MTSKTPALATLAVLALAAAQCGDGDAATQPPPGAGKGIPTPSGQDPIRDGTDRVRMVVSASMHGRLEPCGCASGQSGGLARRFFYLGERPDQHDLLIEGGNLIEDGTELDFQKLFKTVEILFAMGTPYHALGVGAKDLQIPLDDWCGVMSAMQVPVVASDLRCVDDQLAWPARPFVEVQVRDKTVRIASLTVSLPEVLGAAEPRRIELLDPAGGWQAALEGAADATLRVLMIHTDDDAIRKLVATLNPAPDLVIAVNDDHSEPTGGPETAAGVPVVHPGIRGRMLLDLSLVRLPAGPRVGYRIQKLEGSKTLPGAMEDKNVKAAILQHRFQVQQDDVLHKMPRTATASGASYVGSLACKDCHDRDYKVWMASKHAKAWETLEKAEADPTRYGWPVTAYPDCVSCHVVGYRQESGFVDYATTKDLAAVGCERCHGPASEHIKAPMRNKLGKVGSGIAAKVCAECHDFEQSPDFVYLTKWNVIRHGDKK